MGWRDKVSGADAVEAIMAERGDGTPAAGAKPQAGGTRERPRIIVPGQGGVVAPGHGPMGQPGRPPLSKEIRAYLQLEQKALIAMPPEKVSVTGHGTVQLIDLAEAELLLGMSAALRKMKGGLLVSLAGDQDEAGRQKVLVTGLAPQAAEALLAAHRHLSAGGALNLVPRPAEVQRRPDCADGQQQPAEAMESKP
ncbi:MAG: hypothetical protein WC789_09355 [Lentisphaeria bacterium]